MLHYYVVFKERSTKSSMLTSKILKLLSSPPISLLIKASALDTHNKNKSNDACPINQPGIKLRTKSRDDTSNPWKTTLLHILKRFHSSMWFLVTVSLGYWLQWITFTAERRSIPRESVIWTPIPPVKFVPGTWNWIPIGFRFVSSIPIGAVFFVFQMETFWYTGLNDLLIDSSLEWFFRWNECVVRNLLVDIKNWIVYVFLLIFKNPIYILPD